MGSFPFFDLRRMALASSRVMLWGAVTRSSRGVMTEVTRSVEEGWNWTSRRVTIPRSLPYSFPLSTNQQYSREIVREKEFGKSEFDGISSPQNREIFSVERKFDNHHEKNCKGGRKRTCNWDTTESQFPFNASHICDGIIGTKHNWIGDKSVLKFLHLAHHISLLVRRAIMMNNTKSTK